MLIREDLRPFNVMIHDPSKESFDIPAGTFRDEEVEKNRDRSSLENFAIWFFKNSTNKFLSLSFSLSWKCIEKSVESWRSIEMQLEFRESAVKVLESRLASVSIYFAVNGKW